MPLVRMLCVCSMCARDAGQAMVIWVGLGWARLPKSDGGLIEVASEEVTESWNAACQHSDSHHNKIRSNLRSD